MEVMDHGRLSWPWVAGWLYTEINVRHRELKQDTVSHLSTNRARRRLTYITAGESRYLAENDFRRDVLRSSTERPSATWHALRKPKVGHLQAKHGRQRWVKYGFIGQFVG